jgi:hypothetical protein
MGDEMNWYKKSQKEYVVDDFMLKSMVEWLHRVVRSEEIDIARESMIMWLQSVDKDEAEYALSQGWRKVYDLAMSDGN